MNALVVHPQPICCRGIEENIVSSKMIKNVTVVHCADAIARMLKKEKFAFLVLDENHSGTDAADHLAYFLKITPKLKILLITECDNAARIRKLFTLGVAGCIYSYAPEEEFTKAIKHFADGETYLSHRFSKLLINEKASAGVEETIKEKAGLSDREHEVYVLLRQKIKPKDIIEMIHISMDTFKTHRRHLRRKLENVNLLYLLDGLEPV
jgi:DNA-binding NarL/FixJ family response regulator